MKRQKTNILFYIIINIALIYSCDNDNTQDVNHLDLYSSVKIDSLIQTFMETENLSGFAVGVVSNNDIIYTKSYGVKNIENIL